VRQLLDRYAACLAPRVGAVLGGAWPRAPIRVDASVYATWFGAYATLAPPRVTVTSTGVGSQGMYGLEVLLHEAGHSLLGPVDSALAAAARQRGRQLPPELSHLILFYTAGELVRAVDPTYVPYAERFGIWSKNGTARRYHKLLGREWQPYLDGRTTLDATVERLVDELPRAQGG
jgi:hypothetical protein